MAEKSRKLVSGPARPLGNPWHDTTGIHWGDWPRMQQSASSWLMMIPNRWLMMACDVYRVVLKQNPGASQVGSNRRERTHTQRHIRYIVPARGGVEVALGIYKNFLIYRTCMRRAPAKPVRACTLRNWCLVSHVTFEAPLRTSHFSLQSSHSTLHTSHSTLHTSHCTLRTPHFASHCTLKTPHSTLHTSHCFLHTPHFILHTSRFSVHTSHFSLFSSHSTLHTPHFTLHSSRPTLHTALFTPSLPTELVALSGSEGELGDEEGIHEGQDLQLGIEPWTLRIDLSCRKARASEIVMAGRPPILQQGGATQCVWRLDFCWRLLMTLKLRPLGSCAREAFTEKLLHIEKLLHTTSFYTDKLLHTASFYTQ